MSFTQTPTLSGENPSVLRLRKSAKTATEEQQRNEDMAKYRHRIFEMFEFRDEAVTALTPRSTHNTIESVDPALWTFQHFEASRRDGVTLITFKEPEVGAEEELTCKIPNELSLISRSLVNNSRVVMDFEGLSAFSGDSMEALTQFNKTLQSKGSRMALCGLEPNVHAEFFPKR